MSDKKKAQADRARAGEYVDPYAGGHARCGHGEILRRDCDWCWEWLQSALGLTRNRLRELSTPSPPPSVEAVARVMWDAHEKHYDDDGEDFDSPIVTESERAGLRAMATAVLALFSGGHK